MTAPAPSSDPKPGGQLADTLKAWLPIVTVVVGGAWAAFVYFDGRDPPAKPPAVVAAPTPAANPQVDQRKFAVFTEASQLAATLANTPVGTEGWATSEARFLQLYWGEMSIYEKGEVENRMVKFRKALEAHKAAPTDDTSTDLKDASLRLAHALRDELAVPR
jgi:hypothetical protein